MQNTIHVIPNPIGFMPYLTHWREAFGDYGFDVKVYDPPEYSLKWKQPGEFEFRAGTCYEFFKNWSIKNGDVVIVCDSWNPIIQMIMDYKMMTAMDIRIFGFWTYTPHNNESKVWKVMKKEKDTRDWYYEYCKSLYGSVDYNCFFNQEHLEVFSRRYARRSSKNKDRFGKRMFNTGWPVGHLFANDVSMDEKENIVLLPMSPLNAAQRTLLKTIETDFPDWKFIYLQRSKPSREAYLRYLRRAKIMFLNRKWEYDPTLIVEAMNYGVYPLIPNVKVAYRFTFPDKYWYSPFITEPNLRFWNKTLWMLRNKDGLVARIADVMDNYSTYYDEIKEDAKKLTDEYFSSDKFKQILFGNR